MSLSLEEMTARSAVFALLARLWLREVDRPLLDDLLETNLRTAFEDTGGVLPANNNNDTLEELAIDYCQLFIGPKHHLPPFQSVWTTGQFQGATVESMNVYLDVANFNRDDIPNGIMPDHLGVQLLLMSHLLREAALWPGDSDEKQSLQELLSTYFTGHLTWAGPLLEAAASKASTDFYRSVIRMTDEFLKSEASCHKFDC
ncbi:MAG: hypothetical protein Tsb009_01830 [Planctomycetaceae bacterium]